MSSTHVDVCTKIYHHQFRTADFLEFCQLGTGYVHVQCHGTYDLKCLGCLTVPNEPMCDLEYD